MAASKCNIFYFRTVIPYYNCKIDPHRDVMSISAAVFSKNVWNMFKKLLVYQNSNKSWFV